MKNRDISTALKSLIDNATESKKACEERIAEFKAKRPETTVAEEAAYRFGWMDENYSYLLKQLLRLTINIDKGES
jgi:hypothetical protein